MKIRPNVETIADVRRELQKLSTFDPLPQANVADPSGGGTQDAEARSAINDILDLLESVGLMKTA